MNQKTNKYPPFVLGIAGGTGSGKTTVSMQIQEAIGPEHLAYIQHDSYYYDQGHLSPVERANQNYDHPDSLDTPLLIEHLQQLRTGQSIASPIYDFETHMRTEKTQLVHSAPIILVEGILIFVEEKLRRLMDMRVYVETASDLRFIRRLQRDIAERGRSLESIIDQYQTTVRPMHLEFVEPSKRFADIIVPWGNHNQVAMELIISRVQTVLSSV